MQFHHASLQYTGVTYEKISLRINSNGRKFSFHGCSTIFGLISVEMTSGNKWCPILAFKGNKVRTKFRAIFSREKIGEHFIILHVCRYLP